MADFAPERTYADKGFASHANRTHLRDNHIKSAIMHRAVKNKPLSERQKNANRRISKIRYIVEQCFGTLKRLFKMGRASYMGTVKVNGQIFAVRNNEIFLMSQPRPERSVHRSEGWTPETVASHAMPALQASFYSLDRSGDVFTWDPV